MILFAMELSLNSTPSDYFSPNKQSNPNKPKKFSKKETELNLFRGKSSGQRVVVWVAIWPWIAMVVVWKEKWGVNFSRNRLIVALWIRLSFYFLREVEVVRLNNRYDLSFLFFIFWNCFLIGTMSCWGVLILFYRQCFCKS